MTVIMYSTVLHIASTAKNRTDALANEEILSALSKRGPEALDVLVEALEPEEDVHKQLIERIRKGRFKHRFSLILCIILNIQNGPISQKKPDLQVCFSLNTVHRLAQSQLVYPPAKGLVFLLN